MDYALATGTGIYHAVGSAAMGPADDDVVDARLRVRGVDRTAVADASVLPVQVSGNTAAPAMLVGYRAADLVLSDFKGVLKASDQARYASVTCGNLSFLAADSISVS